PLTGALPEAALRLSIFGHPVPLDHELAVPLVASGITAGAIVLARARRGFEPGEVDTLNGLGRQAAIALGNALNHRSLEIAHDTMRRQAEELQRANRRAEAERAAAARERDTARAVIRSVRESILLVDGAGRVALANDLLGNLVGRPADELIGAPATALWSTLAGSLAAPDQLTAFLDRIAAAPDLVISGTLRQQTPCPRQWQVYSLPLPDESGQCGRLFVLRDITHEAEVDRMKTEFVSLVSHELRTPLTSIKGYVELLLDYEVGDLNEDQIEFLQIVRSNSDRLVALINDLLDISRIEQGRVELHRAPLDLSAVLDQAVTTLRMAIAEKDQQLTIELPADLPPVDADPDRLTQVLTNLISNAHKYTPAGGRIGVSAEVGGDRVAVRVADTGIGLTPTERDQLFTKFYRAHNPAAQGIGGTGLGLAITKSIVELHGGRIWVDSEPGHGSTFHFTVPVVGAPPAAIQPAPVAQPVSVPAPARLPRAEDHWDGASKVLVVDDEPPVADLLRRYLERAGYQVTVAHGGAEALTLAKQQRFDLITLDVLMPDFDGLMMLEQLRAQAATSATPVLMVSVLSPQNGSLALQPVDHMTKPVDEQTLLRRVERGIRNRRDRQVLVADDDPDIRRLFVQFLRQGGYEALEAADGFEALDLARDRHPAVILLDVRMPRLDGIETLRALRSDPATRSIPVIIMTASVGALEQSRDEAIRLGVSDLLDKPTAPEEIVAFLDRELGRSRVGR
ncbi:MAG TPA: response regulator, partial [Dehalococcoidia bacterium]|nr:response regulator [Dehalococcoidia bacterium]